MHIGRFLFSKNEELFLIKEQIRYKMEAVQLQSRTEISRCQSVSER